ncbi:putative quinate permease [Thozetella sp. PMI_491]|nr:putative quinate permease [Thozetella sp. PMI_491]
MQTVSAARLSLMYVGRILTGLTVGSSAMCVPIYISESSPPTIRGCLVGLFEITIQVFGLIGFWINYRVQHDMPSTSAQWQVPFALQLIPAGLLIVSMIFMKESPRWLARNSKMGEASQVLAYVRNLPEWHEYVQTELAEMQQQAESESRTTSANFWRESWKEAARPGVRNRIVLAVSLKVMQNLTGTQAVNYYSPVIFQSIGTSTSLLVTGVFGLVKMFMTNVTMFFAVDSIGRRPLFLLGSIGSAIPMFYLGAYSKISNSFDASASSPDATAYVAVTMIYLFAIFFALSWNGVPWIFASEVFPTRIRTLGLMISMYSTSLVQFIIV